jgi:competence protein ComEC
MVLACTCLGIANVALRGLGEQPLREVATNVPRCSGEVSVLESVAGGGNLVRIRHLDCEGASYERPGDAFADEDLGPPGASARGTFRVVPLSLRNPYDVDKARLGAAARLQPLEVEVSPPSSPAMAAAENARSKLSEVTAPWGPGGALVMGLTIGDTSELNPATIEDFRRAGLSHLVAVSGSNLAILLGAAAFAFRGLGHRLRIVVAASLIVFFVLVVGPQPSVLRAAAMGAVVVAATGWGRSSEPMLALALAISATIAWRPALVFSVGLQLSAAATAGIVMWTGRLAPRLHRLPDPVAIALAATLSAQAAVAPLLIGIFGELSLVAPLANLLAFPAVGPATILGVAAGSVAVVHPLAGELVARPAAAAAGWILEVAERAGALPWASVDVPRWWAFPIALLLLPAIWNALVPRPANEPSTASQASRTLAG